MKRYFFLTALVILICTLHVTAGDPPAAGDKRSNAVSSLNAQEQELAGLINEYRRSKGLKAVPLSASLCKVARLHATDLSNNYIYGGHCNLHSWSEDPRWSSCCYTPDHKTAECMWNKPRELTAYPADGYEIAFYSNHDYSSIRDLVADALNGWKSSPGHHDLIINRGKWKTAKWQAMGVGFAGGFTIVWFGEVPDPEGMPSL